MVPESTAWVLGSKKVKGGANAGCIDEQGSLGTLQDLLRTHPRIIWDTKEVEQLSLNNSSPHWLRVTLALLACLTYVQFPPASSEGDLHEGPGDTVRDQVTRKQVAKHGPWVMSLSVPLSIPSLPFLM